VKEEQCSTPAEDEENSLKHKKEEDDGTSTNR
jgi:hypothetical protein